MNTIEHLRAQIKSYLEKHDTQNKEDLQSKILLITIFRVTFSTTNDNNVSLRQNGILQWKFY